VGARIAALRKARGLTLSRLAAACGVSESTISRIENGLTAVSAHHLFAMAKLLDVDVTEFFDDDSAPLTGGMRSVTRRGEGVREEFARYGVEVLSADLSRKDMHPAINTVTARSLDEVGGLARHDGEEFLYVLDGAIILHSELYAPLRLEAGDSIYFDGGVGHAYLAAGEAPARILVVVAVDGRALELKSTEEERGAATPPA
jgi:transcriptional regulator with XRE-family HTH domain